MVLVDVIIKDVERQELTKIYNNLSPTLKRQLLTIAHVIETTREITLNESNKKQTT